MLKVLDNFGYQSAETRRLKSRHCIIYEIPLKARKDDNENIDAIGENTN